MKAIPLGELITHCAHCGVRFRVAERALHSCEGEIKMRDVEIGRLKDLLARAHALLSETKWQNLPNEIARELWPDVPCATSVPPK